MSDTTNKPSVNSILPAATSAEASAIASLVLGFGLLSYSEPVQFLLGGPDDGFGKLFGGYLIITALSIVFAVLALTKSAAGWIRAAAGGGILLSILGVVFAILTKLFS